MEKNLENIRFGIEIEVEFPTKEDSQELINKRRLIPGWEIDCDFSLDNGAEYRPKKNNKLYYNKDTFEQIEEIIGLIKAHKGNIRPTCSIHIHIDMKQFKDAEIVNIVKAFIKEQDGLYKRCKVIKKREEEYAKKIPKTALKELSKDAIKQLRRCIAIRELHNDYFNDKYYGLNITSLTTHRTLEFRLFNGSIQSRRIKKYIKWCLEFCIKKGIAK